MFARWKEDVLRGSDSLVEKVQELGADARKQIRVLELKKDRFLVQKELGELVFRLITVEGRQQIESDLHVSNLVHQLKTLETAIRDLEQEQI